MEAKVERLKAKFKSFLRDLYWRSWCWEHDVCFKHKKEFEYKGAWYGRVCSNCYEERRRVLSQKCSAKIEQYRKDFLRFLKDEV